jgi:hypothetical protein
MLADKIYTNVRSGDLRRPLEYVVELTGITIIYVGLAKLSLALASIHPTERVGIPAFIDIGP